MATKTPTKQRLVECAIQRFYRDGFRNVGIDQILSDVGISKTAFYKHFESKEDLMLAALTAQNEWLKTTLKTMIQEKGGPSAFGQLHAIFDVVDMIIESEGFHGCIFINATMEFPLAHDPVHVVAAECKAAIENIVYILALEAQATHPKELAKEICMIMDGAYVTRQVTGSKETINTARNLAKTVILKYCPENESE